MENRGKILVTGTAGFIGYHLSKRLINQGCEVVGLDCINDYYDINLKYGRLETVGIDRNEILYNKFTQSKIYKNYRFIKLNLEDKENIENLFLNEKFNKVINLAAQANVRYSLKNPYAYINSNIIGFFNILESSVKINIDHLIYASSSSVYGLNKKIPFSTKDDTSTPISLYAASKKSNELMAHAYSYIYNIPTTGLRFFTVYGPWGRPDMALFIFTKSILENKPIDVYNFGNMKRDFTYVDDVIEGIWKILNKQPNNKCKLDSEDDPIFVPFKIYNIGSNTNVSLLSYIEEIERNLNIKAQKNFLPLQPCDVVSTYADVNDLIEDFDYKPNTPISKGIAEFIKWYKNFYNI